MRDINFEIFDFILRRYDVDLFLIYKFEEKDDYV